eukprot:scaffold781_cov132-Cylindrotheca_fusiformis.AAC.18
MVPSIRRQHFKVTAALILLSLSGHYSSALTPRTSTTSTVRNSARLDMQSSIIKPMKSKSPMNRQLEKMMKNELSSPPILQATPSLQDFCMPVLWTSLLITSNTVGAGMLVLPELAEGPGMGLSLGLFFILYVINLASGWMIAEVAIAQKEQSGQDAPSSFKAFAEANLPYSSTKDAIATVSVVKNALVLAFGTMKAGELLGMGDNNSNLAASVLWAIAFCGLMGTQSAPKLSKVASVFVVGLFSSFLAILIPGLTHLERPVMDILTAPPTAMDPITDLVQVAPIILMSFIFQNIVPTTVRILDYNRTQIALSMAIGTFFPFLMYTAWCLAVLGGGVDSTNVGMEEGSLYALFSLVTIAGSHLGSSTSIAEELDTYLRDTIPNDEEVNEEDRKNQVFSWPSVLITGALAIGLGEGFAGNLNDLLSLAGAYGSPLLYFVLPVVMMWNQQQQQQQQPLAQEPQQKDWAIPTTIPLAISASMAAGFVGTEVFHIL